MKIIQVLTHLNIHDAIGNEVLAMDEELKQQGYDARIMAFKIHERLRSRAESMDLSVLNPEDIVIFHKATGDLLTGKVAGLHSRKIMVYHNITPARFFLCYDPMMTGILRLGRMQVRRYASRMDACWAVSEYNAREIHRYGVPPEKTAVLPILVSQAENRIQPDPVTVQKLQTQKGTKMLYIGRIAPNKKAEDVIKAYTVYRDQYDPDARLYLIGSWDGLEKYYAKLKGFAADLGLTEDQVVFTGRVSDEEREAYLRNTEVLVCLSEHEGFCVPLLEAASRELPILAYGAAAVPETLGDSGILFEKKDYGAMADAIRKLQTDESFRKQVIQKQLENLKRFDREQTRQQFLRLIAEMTGDPNNEADHEEEGFVGVKPVFYQGKQTGTKIRKFKPLWMVHNRTYRQLAKGATTKKWKETFAKVAGMLRR